MDQTNRHLIDTLTERPLQVVINGRTMYIRPATLGTTILAETELSEAGWGLLSDSDEERMLHLATHTPHKVGRYIAYHIIKGDKRQSLHIHRIDVLAREVCNSLSTQELASLALMILKRSDTTGLLDALGVTKDLEARAKVIASKSDKDWASFGGRTIYGALIDPLAERYGWTLDYILWGISYANVRLLLSDQQSNIYKGRDGDSNRDDNRVIDADDPDNEEEIARLLGE